MKVTHVAIRPTEAAIEAERPALTPELLAASGARYSRNNDGLEAILQNVDPERLDASVDRIFRLIDYGHQSIADMAPVAMFMDGISLWLAYYVWTLCPTAGGQESSTRYLKLQRENRPNAKDLGIPAELRTEWERAVDQSFDAYEEALELWEKLGDEHPHLTRIPSHVREDTSPKGKRCFERMQRNYAFDRARYFIPLAAPTNVMLVMSARGWANLCQHLCSYALPEPRALGEAIRQELALCAPRLIKHATRKESIESGLLAEFRDLRSLAASGFPACLAEGADSCAHPPEPYLDLQMPPGVTTDQLERDLEFHANRYDWLGSGLRRGAVRFGWQAMAMAEIRDLNRHRTGTKYAPLLPRGFYAAADELPSDSVSARRRLRELNECGRWWTARSVERLIDSDPSYIYWCLLGTQFPFEHVTTADKFLYEAELRTGLGAHYRYARHFHDMLGLWFERCPETRGLVLEGQAEPE